MHSNIYAKPGYQDGGQSAGGFGKSSLPQERAIKYFRLWPTRFAWSSVRQRQAAPELGSMDLPPGVQPILLFPAQNDHCQRRRSHAQAWWWWSFRAAITKNEEDGVESDSIADH